MMRVFCTIDVMTPCFAIARALSASSLVGLRYSSW